MACLVAGGCGFYGMWICRSLAKRGVEVIAFDLYPYHPEDRVWDDVIGESVLQRDTTPKRRIWTDDVSHLIKMEQGDGRHLSDVLTVFKKHNVRSVVNTIAFIPGSGASPQDRFVTDVVATFNLLEAARILPVDRFIQTTTTGVYPAKRYYQKCWKGGYEPVTEEHPVGSAATHQVDCTKAFAEVLGVRYADVFGIKFLSLRSSTTFGPGRRVWRNNRGNETKVLMEAAQGRETRFEQGGETEFDPLYIRDYAEAVAMLHEHPSPSFQIYNVVRGEPLTFSSFLDVINAVTGLHCIAGPGQFPGKESQGRISNARIASEIGWRARYGIKDAVAEYVEYLRGGDLG